MGSIVCHSSSYKSLAQFFLTEITRYAECEVKYGWRQLECVLWRIIHSSSIITPRCVWKTSKFADLAANCIKTWLSQLSLHHVDYPHKYKLRPSFRFKVPYSKLYDGNNGFVIRLFDWRAELQNIPKSTFGSFSLLCEMLCIARV